MRLSQKSGVPIGQPRTLIPSFLRGKAMCYKLFGQNLVGGETLPCGDVKDRVRWIEGQTDSKDGCTEGGRRRSDLSERPSKDAVISIGRKEYSGVLL